MRSWRPIGSRISGGIENRSISGGRHHGECREATGLAISTDLPQLSAFVIAEDLGQRGLIQLAAYFATRFIGKLPLANQITKSNSLMVDNDPLALAQLAVRQTQHSEDRRIKLHRKAA
jgi:hypothetical protein